MACSCRHIFRVGQAINELGLDLTLVAARWKRKTAAEVDSLVLAAKREVLARLCGSPSEDPSTSTANELQQLKDYKTLFALARGLASRASSDGPGASRLVESKSKEIEILLERYEMDNMASASDAAPNDESSSACNPCLVKGNARPRTKHIRSFTEQTAAAAKRGKARRANDDNPGQ